MKKHLIALIAGLTIASSVYAACTTHTYIVNGRLMTCTTCCYGSSCTTNCL